MQLFDLEVCPGWEDSQPGWAGEGGGGAGFGVSDHFFFFFFFLGGGGGVRVWGFSVLVVLDFIV